LLDGSTGGVGGEVWTCDGQTNGINFNPFVCPSPWLLDGSGYRSSRQFDELISIADLFPPNYESISMRNGGSGGSTNPISSTTAKYLRRHSSDSSHQWMSDAQLFLQG
jgi:hypothetical protein